jgi:hypothetical protein
MDYSSTHQTECHRRSVYMRPAERQRRDDAGGDGTDSPCDCRYAGFNFGDTCEF